MRTYLCLLICNRRVIPPVKLNLMHLEWKERMSYLVLLEEWGRKNQLSRVADWGEVDSTVWHHLFEKYSLVADHSRVTIFVLWHHLFKKYLVVSDHSRVIILYSWTEIRQLAVYQSSLQELFKRDVFLFFVFFFITNGEPIALEWRRSSYASVQQASHPTPTFYCYCIGKFYLQLIIIWVCLPNYTANIGHSGMCVYISHYYYFHTRQYFLIVLVR